MFKYMEPLRFHIHFNHHLLIYFMMIKIYIHFMLKKLKYTTFMLYFERKAFFLKIKRKKRNVR